MPVTTRSASGFAAFTAMDRTVSPNAISRAPHQPAAITHAYESYTIMTRAAARSRAQLDMMRDENDKWWEETTTGSVMTAALQEEEKKEESNDMADEPIATGYKYPNVMTIAEKISYLAELGFPHPSTIPTIPTSYSELIDSAFPSPVSSPRTPSPVPFVEPQLEPSQKTLSHVENMRAMTCNWGGGVDEFEGDEETDKEEEKNKKLEREEIEILTDSDEEEEVIPPPRLRRQTAGTVLDMTQEDEDSLLIDTTTQTRLIPGTLWKSKTGFGHHVKIEKVFPHPTDKTVQMLTYIGSDVDGAWNCGYSFDLPTANFNILYSFVRLLA